MTTPLRSFTLTLSIPIGSPLLFINSVRAVQGFLTRGPESRTLLHPSESETWVTQSPDPNTPIHMILTATAPRSSAPLEISCNVPIFGDPTYNVRNAPTGYQVSEGTIFAPQVARASLALDIWVSDWGPYT